MARRRPSTPATSGDFAQSLRASIQGIVTPSSDKDPERKYLATPAPNAIQWVINREYLNSPSLIENIDPETGAILPGYWRSYQVIRDTFQLRCPVCNEGGVDEGEPGDCWGRSREYLESELLLEWSEEHHDDVCPKCANTREQLVDDKLIIPINQALLVCGQRSGKSIVGGLVGTYIEHRLINISLGPHQGLRRYLGLTVKDPFEMTFLAASAVQAKDTIWAKYRAFRRDSPWFQRYVPWIKNQEESQVTPPGMERWVYQESNDKITNEYPDLFLITNSMNSNSSTTRGRTRVFAGEDEISHMLDGDSRLSADEIHRSLENSLQTVRSRATMHKRPSWLGLMLSVTSPKSLIDKGMRLLEAAPQTPGMMWWHYPTWEFNPFEPFEAFAALFAQDPVGTWRDFGAKPPSTATPLITDVYRFRENAVDWNAQATATFVHREFTEAEQPYIGLSLVWAKLDWNHSRFIAFDAGLNFDAFAAACAHPEVSVDEDGNEVIHTVYDWIVRIIPPVGTEVYFSDMPMTVGRLQKKQSIIRAEFDHWNSTQMIQQLRKMGIRAESVNGKSDDYRRFRADGYTGLVKLLPPNPDDYNSDTMKWIVDPPLLDPASSVFYELEALEQDPTTLKVSNPLKGQRRGWNSNDVAAVVVHVHKMVQEAGFSERDGDMSKRARRKRMEVEAGNYVRMGGGGVYNPTRSAGGSLAGPRNWSKPPGGRGW